MIRRINGKGSNSVNYLKKGNSISDSPKDIADTLAETFARKSSGKVPKVQNHIKKEAEF